MCGDCGQDSPPGKAWPGKAALGPHGWPLKVLGLEHRDCDGPGSGEQGPQHPTSVYVGGMASHHGDQGKVLGRLVA